MNGVVPRLYLRPRATAMAQDPDADDRKIVRYQLWFGTFLVVFGASLLLLFKWSNLLAVGAAGNDSLNAIGSGASTAVIGVGAALLPGGAAASASSRILAGLPTRSSSPSIGAATGDAANRTVSSVVMTTAPGGRALLSYGQNPAAFDKQASLSLASAASPQRLDFVGLNVAANDKYQLLIIQSDGQTVESPVSQFS